MSWHYYWCDKCHVGVSSGYVRTTCEKCNQPVVSNPIEERPPMLNDQDGIGFLCCRCGKRYINSIAADTCCKPLNAHYRHTSIDPLQYVEAMGDAEYRGACILNIVKYITRYPHKGTPMEDLMKAQDYVKMLIEHQRKKESKP